MAYFHGLQVGGDPNYLLTGMILQAGISLWSFLIIQIDFSNVSNPSYWSSKSIATGTSNIYGFVRLLYLHLSQCSWISILGVITIETTRSLGLYLFLYMLHTYLKFMLYPNSPTIAYPRLRETLKKRHCKCMVFSNWSWTTAQIDTSSEQKNLEILGTR